MSKFPKSARVLDLSDYGRVPARWLARILLPLGVSSHAVTLFHAALGLFAAWLIVNREFVWAGFLLPVRSVLDAVDGELARLRKRPSYVGRYLDTLVDFPVYLSIFGAICWVTQSSVVLGIGAFFSLQIQCSIFNMYYVKKRHQVAGDLTSRTSERTCPTPFPWDNPVLLGWLHFIYLIGYSWQDKLVRWLDPSLKKDDEIPNGFLAALSLLGSGCQLLVMAFFLSVLKEPVLILYFFLIPMNLYALALVLTRRYGKLHPFEGDL